MNQIEMKNVHSSQITSIGYDQDLEVLYVEFRNSNVYRYMDVPKEIYEQFMNNDSVGSYFHTHIKDEYEYEKLNMLVNNNRLELEN
jgi:lysyl-tRNA synthetase class 2